MFFMFPDCIVSMYVFFLLGKDWRFAQAEEEGMGVIGP